MRRPLRDASCFIDQYLSAMPSDSTDRHPLALSTPKSSTPTATRRSAAPAKPGWSGLLLPAIDFREPRAPPRHRALLSDRTPTWGCTRPSTDNPRWREELALVERYLRSPPEGVDDLGRVGEIDSITTTGTTASRPNSSRHSRNSAAWPRPMTFPSPLSIRGRPGKICAALSKRNEGRPRKGLRLRVFSTPAEDADTYRQLKECATCPASAVW